MNTSCKDLFDIDGRSYPREQVIRCLVVEALSALTSSTSVQAPPRVQRLLAEFAQGASMETGGPLSADDLRVHLDGLRIDPHCRKAVRRHFRSLIYDGALQAPAGNNGKFV